MAFLGVHANVQPSEFDAMTRADSLELARAVEAEMKADIEVRVKLAEISRTRV